MLQYIADQEMTKEREELLNLLIKIDKHRNPNDDSETSQRRLITILRDGIKPCRGLKDAIDSLQEKYDWSQGKVKVSKAISFTNNIVIGWGLTISDVWTDCTFAALMFRLANSESSHLTPSEWMEAGIVSVVHIILPWVFTILMFIMLLVNKVIKRNKMSLLRLPLPLVTKAYKTKIEWNIYNNNRRRGNQSEYEKRKEMLQVKSW